MILIPYLSFTSCGIISSLLSGKSRISSIENLTPGHIKAISQRRFFGENEISDHDTIIDELENERYVIIEAESRKVGNLHIPDAIFS